MKTLLSLLLSLGLSSMPAVARQHDHARMHGANHGDPTGSSGATELSSGGEAIFEALAEVVAVLESDPTTDWSAVDIDALRAHLLDMTALFQRAEASTEEIPGGARFRITGPPDALTAAGRMGPAHARMLESEHRWSVSTTVGDDAVVLEVTGPDQAAADRIRGLGFFGLMSSGSHHRPHHLAIARGRSPHH